MERILVLDDDESVLVAVKEALTYLNFEVATLQSPKRLFDVINEFQPNLLLLDFMLTNSNGGAICHQIKSNDALCNLPVIMMSGYNDVTDQAEKSGADNFIKKPFDLIELERKITTCLNSKRTSSLQEIKN